MLIGLVLAPVIILRILWGFIGTKHARFSSFIFGPKEVFAYLSSIFSSKGKYYVGLNPAASYAAFAMLILALGVVATGLLTESGEIFEEAHEILPYIMFAVVVVHVCGVILHVVRNNENTFSMFSGTKAGEEHEAIPSSKPIVAIVFLLLMGTWTTAVVRGYDRQTGSVGLHFMGQSIQLVEGESQEDDGHNHEGERHDHDDD